MQKIYNFNGVDIAYNDNTFGFLNKKLYGINKKFKKIIALRFEQKKLINFLKINNLKKNSLFYFLFLFIPENKKIKTKHILNICLLDLLHTYKGWRHLQGLPVNGQRTWSNAWSSYKTNLLLRQFKLNLAKKIYGNVSLHEINTALAAEQYNLLWKLQWENDWLEAKKKRLNILKNKTAFIKVDLAAMARGQITKLGKTAKVGKKKREFKRNVFNLGFDVGFTKKLFNQKKQLRAGKAQVQLLSANKSK